MNNAKIHLIPKAKVLWSDKRYIVLYGGRGSGKSHSVAKALLIQGAEKKVRNLCAREVQKSIKASVHQLLRDQIVELGLESFYQVLETEIRGINGTQFMFAGLADHTVDSIKSFEGIDNVWIEEGQTISKKSLDILIPTIRKDGSRIIITFNPELDSDEVYKRYVTNPPDNCISMEVNWSDNPWFPKVLDEERQQCKLRAPDDYDTIWEGKCRPTVQGAIYANEIRQLIEQKRVRNVPYDPMLLVHTVWDLGWNDKMTISCVQRAASEIRVIKYIEDSHRTLDSYIKDLKQNDWNWGHDWIPHDGRTKNFQTGISTEEMLKKLGRSPMIVPNIGIEEGIKLARMTLPRMYIDESCSELVEHWKRYRRQINQQTNQPGAPLHDEHSHAADNLRYIAVAADRLTNEVHTFTPVIDTPVFDTAIGY